MFCNRNTEMADFSLDAYEPFKLFYIRQDGSLFHAFLCFATMTPLWILTYLIIVLMLYKKNQQRNVLLLIAFTSSIALNKILKRIINHPRPYDIYSGHGMPSDHAQFTFLWAGYSHQLLSHYQRFNWSKFNQSQHKLYILMTWIWCLIVCYSRYALLFHSIPQLIVGGIIGICLSLFWYKIDQQFIFDTSNGGAYIPFSLHMD